MAFMPNKHTIPVILIKIKNLNVQHRQSKTPKPHVVRVLDHIKSLPPEKYCSETKSCPINYQLLPPAYAVEVMFS